MEKFFQLNYFMRKMSHYVYMLECKGARIYTGYATDVEKRFEAHRQGKGARFTKAFPPQKILKVFALKSKHDALRLEALIKRQSVQAKRDCILLPDGILPGFFYESPRGSGKNSPE